MIENSKDQHSKGQSCRYDRRVPRHIRCDRWHGPTAQAWQKYSIKTSWFVPAHSVESFPNQIAKIRDAGHEIGLHGYTHEFVSGLSEKQERDVLKKSIDVLTAFTGHKPKGWTAPAWATSKRSIKLLEEFGIVSRGHSRDAIACLMGWSQEYDHSFMHHDSQLYYVLDCTQQFTESNYRTDAAEWMVPMTKLSPSNIVEVPANWHLDDWPPMQPKMPAASGFVDPHVVERLWKEQFDFFF